MKNVQLFHLPAFALIVAGTVMAVGCDNKESARPQVGQEISQSKDLFSEPPTATLPTTTSANPTTVVAIVNGQNITQGEIDAETLKMMDMTGRKMPPERLAQMKDRFAAQSLENLILKTVLMAEVEKEKVAITDVEKAEAIAKFTNSLPPNVTLDDLIAKNNWSRDEFDKNLTLNLRINKLLENQTKSAVQPTDADLKKFYEENVERFKNPESVTASHILIATEASDTDEVKAAKKDKAEKLREKLIAGADFAALAAENSDCPSKTRGGNLDSFTRGTMAKPFEDAAFGQKVGEIGPVVETQFGYHIIKVTKHEEPHTTTFDDAKDRIAKGLEAQNKQELARKFIDELKAKADIQYPEGEPPAHKSMMDSSHPMPTPQDGSHTSPPPAPPVPSKSPSAVPVPAPAPVTPFQAPASNPVPTPAPVSPASTSDAPAAPAQ